MRSNQKRWFFFFYIESPNHLFKGIRNNLTDPYTGSLSFRVTGDGETTTPYTRFPALGTLRLVEISKRSYIYDLKRLLF